MTDAETRKQLQNLNKGLMHHSIWLMKRREEPGYDELLELVAKGIRSVNRLMRDMNNAGKKADSE